MSVKAQKPKAKIKANSVVGNIILWLAVLAVILPLVWVFLTSLNSNQDFYSNVWGLPKEWVWSNYARAWERGNIGSGVINSVVVSLGALAVNLVCSTTSAYALSRFEFRGRKALYGLYVAAIMVPSIITLIPQYFMLLQLNLLDTRLGLILVYGLSSVPFSTFMLFGFFKALPHELEEAAMIDGAGYIKTFRTIMLPLAQPGVITVMIVNFIDYWNEYYKAMSYVTTPSKLTIPVGLVQFTQQSQYRIDWGALMASNIIMIIPTIVVYCIFQNSIQKGLTAGAVKG